MLVVIPRKMKNCWELNKKNEVSVCTFVKVHVVQINVVVHLAVCVEFHSYFQSKKKKDDTVSVSSQAKKKKKI